MYRPYLSLEQHRVWKLPKKSTLVEEPTRAWGCLSHNFIICSGTVIWLTVFRTGFWLPANSLQWWNRAINTQRCCENTHGASQTLSCDNNSSAQISHKEIFPECRMRVLCCEKAQERSAKHTEKKSSGKSPPETSYLIFVYSQTLHSYGILGGKILLQSQKPVLNLTKINSEIKRESSSEISVKQSAPFAGSEVILTGYCFSKAWRRQNEKILVKICWSITEDMKKITPNSEHIVFLVSLMWLT